MKSIRLLTLGGIFTGFAIIFQSIPALFSEIFALLAILSSIPIYIISRINPSAGLTSYFASAVILLAISLHEAIFFLFTTGLIGLSLGVSQFYFKSKFIAVLLTSLQLTITLYLITYGLGIPVFGFSIDLSTGLQTLVLFVFSLCYNTFFINIANPIYQFLLPKLFADI
ncbi:MAG: hypothetical protein K0R31_610 [Clostridiales bacterium]|nr:hypothetical protein [Clostridiales bacterium]